MLKILVVDDNEDMVETLERLFSFYQFHVLTAVNGEEAVVVAEAKQPDVILLDAHMPVMDGFEACKILKKKRKTKDIPIVILTAKYLDFESRASGLELGADDYLVKPFNSKELVNRIKTILKKTQILSSLKQKSKELSKRQLQMREEMQETRRTDYSLKENMAIDHLTGLYSQKYLWTRLKEEYHRALRYKTQISFILLDVDSFNRINDSLSYQAGDYILMKIANTILNNTRISDIVARLNGAYFAVILPQTDAQGGFFEAERLRVSLNQDDYIDDFLMELGNLQRKRKVEPRNITASLGVANFPGETEMKNEKALFALAKKALDKAKTSGKNKTFTFTELV